MKLSRTNFLALYGAGLTGAALLVWLTDGSLQHSAVATLLWLLPAVGWARLVRGGRGERLAFGAGLALLLNALVTLLAHYLPGPVPRWLLLVGALLVATLPLLPTVSPPRFPWPVPRHWLPDLLLLAGALALRVLWLGYKEFQGDEGTALVRAAAALTGNDGTLFLHQKGPLEILLPMQLWGLAGATHELWLRLPFAWAGILGVLAIWLLGRRWFGRAAGRYAALLFALVGFAIAFGRIVQYQSLVVLFGTLAVLAAQRYRTDGAGSDLLLSGLFFAGGLLAHYDAVLVAPTVGWLLLRRVVAERRIDWRSWGIALLAGLGALALFYLPYVLNPNFARTFAYLLGDRVGVGSEGAAGGDLAGVWRMLTFYNSTYFIGGLLILIAPALAGLARTRRGMAAVLLWLTPTLFYTLIVSDGRTHVYTLFPGGCLLAGMALERALTALRGRRAAHALALTLVGAWLFVSAAYVYLLFVDHTPERQRTWEVNRPPFNPVTWDAPPDYGLFGFPYQAGWRVVHELVGDDLPYASNEEEEITNMYMRQAERTHCNDYATFILAENVQDAIPYDPVLLNDLHLHAVVTIGGQPKLHIYKRTPAAAVTQRAADGARFWLDPTASAPSTPYGAFTLNAVLGGRALLRGYDLDTSAAYPGGQIRVRLYWQALAPFAQNYQSFVHIYDGTLWGQDDGAPECGVNPTTRWEPGQIIPDLRTIPIALDAPVGQPIPLLAGMYNLLDNTRLAAPGHPNDLILLTEVTLQPPPAR